MMKNRVVALLCCLPFLLALMIPVAAEEGSTATEAERVEEMYESVLQYQLRESGADSVQTWIDTTLSRWAGRGDSEWYLIALAQSGVDYDFSAYQAALTAYLKEHDGQTVATRQKLALTLAALGETDLYIALTLATTLGEGGVMGNIFGLHFLTNGYTDAVWTPEVLVEQMLYRQHEDGGWSVSGTVSDVDVTAMALQALAPYTESASVAAATEAALALLSERQQPEGDFISYGVGNPESGAQVLMALAALGLDMETDERFIKNGHTVLDGIEKYRISSGGYCHTAGGKANANATMQVFCATVAYLRMAEGKTPFYVLDDCDAAGSIQLPTGYTPDTGKSDTVSGDMNGADGMPRYRLVLLVVLPLLGAAVSLILVLCKKRSYQNFIALWLAVALLMALTAFVDVQLPDAYYGEEITKENPIGTVTVSIRCDAVAASGKTHIPANGVILEATTLEIEAGETVYDVLLQVTRQQRIQLENNGTDDMAYIAGIHYLYEMDFGDLSGWVYLVNGERASVGCSSYVLRDGDVIEWQYTLSMGEDLN